MSAIDQLHEQTQRFLQTIAAIMVTAEKELSEKQTALDEETKKLEGLREQALALEQQRALIEREKVVDRERKASIDRQEEAVKAKAEKLQRLLAE